MSIELAQMSIELACTLLREQMQIPGFEQRFELTHRRGDHPAWADAFKKLGCTGKPIRIIGGRK